MSTDTRSPNERLPIRVGDRFRNPGGDDTTFTVVSIGYGADRVVRIEGPSVNAVATYSVAMLRLKVRLS